MPDRVVPFTLKSIAVPMPQPVKVIVRCPVCNGPNYQCVTT